MPFIYYNEHNVSDTLTVATPLKKGETVWVDGKALRVVGEPQHLTYGQKVIISWVKDPFTEEVTKSYIWVTDPEHAGAQLFLSDNYKIHGNPPKEVIDFIHGRGNFEGNPDVNIIRRRVSGKDTTSEEKERPKASKLSEKEEAHLQQIVKTFTEKGNCGVTIDHDERTISIEPAENDPAMVIASFMLLPEVEPVQATK